MSQTGASTIRHLYQEQFYTFEYAYPSVEEQKIIASYLDKKVNAINESIKELESTIEEYQKWKASVIYKAVTQGIDDSLQMKETDLPGAAGQNKVLWLINKSDGSTARRRTEKFLKLKFDFEQPLLSSDIFYKAAYSCSQPYLICKTEGIDGLALKILESI